jgi:hypothetical protein
MGPAPSSEEVVEDGGVKRILEAEGAGVSCLVERIFSLLDFYLRFMQAVPRMEGRCWNYLT